MRDSLLCPITTKKVRRVDESETWSRMVSRCSENPQTSNRSAEPANLQDARNSTRRKRRAGGRSSTATSTFSNDCGTPDISQSRCPCSRMLANCTVKRSSQQSLLERAQFNGQPSQLNTKTGTAMFRFSGRCFLPHWNIMQSFSRHSISQKHGDIDEFIWLTSLHPRNEEWLNRACVTTP